MSPGDRVIITATSHPWHDEIGRIVEAADYKLQRRMGLEWVVQLETGHPGHRLYASSDELRVLA